MIKKCHKMMINLSLFPLKKKKKKKNNPNSKTKVAQTSVRGEIRVKADGPF